MYRLWPAYLRPVDAGEREDEQAKIARCWRLKHRVRNLRRHPYAHETILLEVENPEESGRWTTDYCSEEVVTCSGLRLPPKPPEVEKDIFDGLGPTFETLPSAYEQPQSYISQRLKEIASHFFDRSTP